MAFSHNSRVADREPAWSDVDKTALPRIAFADMGDPEKKSTWGFPHHWVSGGTEKDDNGIWTNGTLYLHRGGLNAAWAAAQGARAGEEAGSAIKAHLNAHRAALGMEASGPQDALLILEASKPDVQARRRSAPRIIMEAYSGGQITQRWSNDPIVLDVSGVKMWRDEGIPIYLNHNPDKIVGHARIVAKNGALICEGKLSGDRDLVELVVRSHRDGFPWAVSIGASVDEYAEIGNDESLSVNGRDFSGPMLLVKRATLTHVALVGEPADPNTRATVIAKKETKIMTEPQKTQVVDPLEVDVALAEGQAAMEAAIAGADAPDDVKSKVRVEALNGLREIKTHALAEKWDTGRIRAELKAHTAGVELTLVRESRPLAPKATTGAKAIDTQVIECALARQAGLRLERWYKPEVMEQAQKLDLTLGQLLIQAARENGLDGVHRITSANVRQVLQHAFPPIRASFSYADIGGILSNVANKFLAAGFEAVEQAWRQISEIRPLKDFKTLTIYRLTDDAIYKPVSAAGEITHGSLGEESYTVQAATYARMFVLTRQDMINDDLGALQDIQRRLGLGAAKALNSIFWQTFLANTDFFTSGHGNVATSCSLSLANLGTAIKAFREMKNADGSPVGVQPKIILVLPALEAVALNIANSTEVRDTTANTKTGTTNIYKGMFTPVVSAYIGSVIGGTAGSDTTWYLLADPRELPVAVVGFLDGKEMPTVESAEADFNVLGIQFRGYHDFGCALAEYRAGVKCTA